MFRTLATPRSGRCDRAAAPRSRQRAPQRGLVRCPGRRAARASGCSRESSRVARGASTCVYGLDRSHTGVLHPELRQTHRTHRVLPRSTSTRRPNVSPATTRRVRLMTDPLAPMTYTARAQQSGTPPEPRSHVASEARFWVRLACTSAGTCRAECGREGRVRRRRESVRRRGARPTPRR